MVAVVVEVWFQSYFIQDYRWKLVADVVVSVVGEGFNPTSFRITVGRTNGTHRHNREVRFQSYFIQDYRWKAIYRYTLPLAVCSFNPTSFRITVGRLAFFFITSLVYIVSILLHSGLPLEGRRLSA